MSAAYRSKIETRLKITRVKIVYIHNNNIQFIVQSKTFYYTGRGLI